MIRVIRGVEPLILRRNKQKWLESLYDASPDRRESIARRYNHVRNQLQLDFAGKCVYCESKVGHVSFGHIEHYRPKGDPRYVQLIFEWTNFLLACTVCNTRKAMQFLESVDGGPILNPCEEEPSEHLAFVLDATVASVMPRTQRGEVTVQVLGLNRPDLREHRSRFIRKVAVPARLAIEDHEASALVKEAAHQSSEYAAFVRQLL